MAYAHMSLMAQWMEEVRQICGPQVPVLLVGCKKDLRDEGARGGEDARFVSTAQVSAAELEERRRRWRRSGHPACLFAATEQPAALHMHADSSRA